MAEGEGGDDGDGEDGDAGEGGEGGEGAGSPPPSSDVDYDSAYGSVSGQNVTIIDNGQTTTVQDLIADAGISGIIPEASTKVPIRVPVIDPRKIVGSKFIRALVMQSPYGDYLIGGNQTGNIPSEGAYITSYVLGSPGAKFYLEIKDIDDDIVFSLSNVIIPANGQYRFNVNFPSSKDTNEYKINLRAGDKSRRSLSLPTIEPHYTIFQRKNPTITFTKSSSDISGISISGDDVTLTTSSGTPLGKTTNALQRTRLTNSTNATGQATAPSIKPFGHFDYVLTVNTSGDFCYIKNTNFNFTNSTIVEKRLLEKVVNSTVLRLNNVVDLKIGMEAVLPNYTKTKTYGVNKTLRVTDTINLKVGMVLTGNGIPEDTTIVSIEGMNVLKISKSISTFDTEIINFRYDNEEQLIIKSIDSDLNKVTLALPLNIDLSENDYTKISFANEEMLFDSTVTGSDSGTNSSTTPVSCTLTCSIQMERMGTEDVTFTVPIDEVFSLKPNANDQYINTKKDTAIDINVLSGDTDNNSSSKTPAFITQPTKGIMSGAFGSGDGTVTYTPNTGVIGDDFFKFKVNDGAVDSETKTVFITITK